MGLGDLPTASPSPSEHKPSQLSIEALEDEITTLSAHLSAATYRLLELIAELNARESWGAWGMRSCAHWLTWKCGIGLVAARDHVRVARALTGLPEISDAMRRGALSYSKARAVTRVATRANEEALLAIALNATASQVERVVQLYRRSGRGVERAETVAQHRDRELSYYWDRRRELGAQGTLAA